jgi:hypothetical protein
MASDRAERAAAIAAIKKAREALTRVCREQSFKLVAMVPARPDKDDDLVISDGIEKALAVLEADDGRAMLRRLQKIMHKECGVRETSGDKRAWTDANRFMDGVIDRLLAESPAAEPAEAAVKKLPPSYFEGNSTIALASERGTKPAEAAPDPTVTVLRGPVSSATIIDEAAQAADDEARIAEWIEQFNGIANGRTRDTGAAIMHSLAAGKAKAEAEVERLRRGSKIDYMRDGVIHMALTRHLEWDDEMPEGLNNDVRRLDSERNAMLDEIDDLRSKIVMLEERVAKAIAALTDIARIAHEGGLSGLTESDAIVQIRRACLPWWRFFRRETDAKPDAADPCDSVKIAEWPVLVASQKHLLAEIDKLRQAVADQSGREWPDGQRMNESVVDFAVRLLRTKPDAKPDAGKGGDDVLDRLLREAADAHYLCGEWHDPSDGDFDDLQRIAEAADAEIRRFVCAATTPDSSGSARLFHVQDASVNAKLVEIEVRVVQPKKPSKRRKAKRGGRA